MLSLMQKDILTELVNVYIGQAANLLSEMVNQKKNLSSSRYRFRYSKRNW